MTLSDTGTPPKRMSTADRSNSSHSISKPSPSNRPRQHKTHVVGHSGLNAHSRNRSYGKNLNNLGKLTKATSEEGPAPKGQKQRERSRSPTSKHMKRNSSNVSLPRVGSKASIKRNTSNVSLIRNASSTHVNKTSSRPTTPVRRPKSRDEEPDNLGSKVTFQMDDENNDDDWTEESNSQSPSVTRQSSASRGGGRSGKSTPGEHNTHARDQRLGADGAEEDRKSYNNTISEGYPQYSVPSRHNSRPPDADAITSRLLNRGNSFRQLDPQVTSISATGTPGTQTPPIPQSQESTSLNEPSMPGDGISRFLNANSASSANSTWQLNNALHHMHTPPTSGGGQSRTRSPSPSREREETIRKAKSAHNLAAAGRANGPTFSQDPESKGLSMTFEAKNRRLGGNTQAKLDLWRTQTHVEPSHNPPAPLMKGTNAANLLGTEEKRARLFDEAEKELGYLRRFRNPVVEGAKRAIKLQKRRDKEQKADHESARSSKEHARGANLTNGLTNGESSHAERGRREENRPVSRAGPRNVRFEVGGMDPGDELAESPEQADGVEALLRSLWAGGEMENVGD